MNDIERAIEFWTRALGYVPKRSVEPGDDFTILVPASGTGARLALNVSHSPVEPYPRIHLDLYAGDSVDQAAEVERLISLGATPVEWDRYPEHADFVVLADTEGNRFCVIDTTGAPPPEINPAGSTDFVYDPTTLTRSKISHKPNRRTIPGGGGPRP